MKKLILLVLIAVLLFTGPSFAYSLKERGRLNENTFKNLIGDKFVSFETFALSSGQGIIFFLDRDNKTRKLEWYLFIQFSGRVLRTGDCPFKAFNETAVSPHGNSALVYSVYPTALWHINLDTKKWTKIFTVISQ